MWTCTKCAATNADAAEECWQCHRKANHGVSVNRASSSSSSAPTIQISALTKRYNDAYLYARAVVGIGTVIKVIGIILAILLLIISLIASGYSRNDPAVALIAGLLLGILIGIPFYVLGVLVSAVGQMLQASLDSAVNGSPFLTNEHKARIMSLPES